MSVSAQSTIESICFRIAQLDPASRQELFDRVEAMKIESEKNGGEVSFPKPKGTFRISDLWGVGAELWRAEGGADEYIRKERESWEERELAWT